MTLSILNLALIITGIYFLLVGLVGLFDMRVSGRVIAGFALAAGILILLGVFVTNTISLA